MAVDCLTMDVDEISAVLTALLYEFPVRELQFYLPAWVSALPADHPLKTALYAALRERTANVSKLREVEPALETVSYTHLDVYKRHRQMGWRPRARNTTPAVV